MDFNEYQEKSAKYDLFEVPSGLSERGFVEKVLGLTGEAGETADRVKKILRDEGGVISDDNRELLVKELGDTLWYIASIARYLRVPLSEVASKNIEKLEDRWQRDKLHGEGDER